jgi:Spy/CpxP family protein refolding chaperone
MKKLFITALLVVGMSALAQDKKEEQKRPEGMERERFSPEQRNQNMLKRMTSDLNLDAKQQEQLTQIFAEQTAKREAMKAKQEKMSDEQREAFRKQMMENRNALNEKIKNILSPEQFQKWNSLKEKRDAKRSEGKEKSDK